MGIWNYRVVMTVDKENKPSFEISEVHYDENNKPYGWGEVMADDSLEELKESYEYMATAFDMPVLKVVDGKLVEQGE
ncbi:hypothetical protein OR571_05515 [Psychrobacillus sp. NEAU-3TGS]|uniref:hypothetical protein n=1 Tax=Psychrobacillus sp. NEAU-3TGS TaxID=2995412 RepID=UPI002497335C|nr:hypothetical protein [Psychrobacillus sp. NEAU-3TGS]MDI2586604.1 hypothetical protein [Psychrobacillus sp. NEAU-3TGS]